MTRSKRVLFATDLTPASEPAFAEALRLAGAPGTELILAHAYEVPYLGEATVVSPEAFGQLDAKLKAGCEARLDALAVRARARGATVRTLMVFGSPYDVIPRVARDERADLVVAGTHGRKGLPRVFLGSVASALISNSPCPVLTVRAA